MLGITVAVALVAAMTFAQNDGAAVGPCEFVCPMSFIQVCGSDGNTYDSACDLRRVACVRRSLNKLTVAHEGPCESGVSRRSLKPCEFVCPMSLVKVCGSDGQTYDSECDLKRVACVRRSLNKLTMAHEGPCDEAVQISEPKPCEFVCPLSLNPVCGSDGQTYDSECDLKRVACVRRSLNKLTMAYDGPCTEVKPCEFVCPMSLVKVCGSDGQTYDSECDLKRVSCIRRSLNKLTMAHEGPCETAVPYNSASPGPCDFVCHFSLVPVCGSDGHTYLNECDLKQISCKRRSLNKLIVAHTGPCECDLVFCRYSEIPVCGTDDNTYKNECDLKKSACRYGADISVKSQGPCAK